VGRYSSVSWDDIQLTWLTQINQVGKTYPRNRDSIAGADYELYLLQSVQAVSEAHSASYSVNGTDYSPRVEQPEGESDHSFPPSAEVRNKNNYTSIPP
jgi:hypothetical protein